MSRFPHSAHLGALGLATALVLSPVLVPTPALADERLAQLDSIEARYQLERAGCLTKFSRESRETCLKEAEGARAEARRGQLQNQEDPRALEENARRRCQDLPAERRADCERMARDDAKVSGSVEGGGVLKEITTRSVETVETPPVPIGPTLP